MHRNIKSLDRQIKEMETYLGQMEVRESQISNASVGWHLAHNLKVINTVVPALKSSSPKHFRRKFSLMKSIVFLTGHIPRGKAKSPKIVWPAEKIELEDLKAEIKMARKNLGRFYELEKNSWFMHPFFNMLNRDQTAKFLVIHTRHHLKIISDILRLHNLPEQK